MSFPSLDDNYNDVHRTVWINESSLVHRDVEDRLKSHNILWSSWDSTEDTKSTR
jgi:hypothetical protein